MSSPAWDPQRWERVTRLFNQTLDMAPPERDAFLAQVERDEPDIGAALRRMLAADAAFTTDTPPSAAGMMGEALDPELPAGTLLGSYAIESCLGMGGMGRVYRAQRVEGGVAQTVAIKCLRFRSRDAEFTRRFLRERKILAGLSHPQIARFLDAGADADGQPFVVMEYVDGTPITEFANARTLPLRGRIELLLKVMGAVAYSHQQLIVHRDIKPGNVLVTPDGEPRLLDFGIAKQLAPLELPQASSTETALEQRAFSPAHAAPEQWKGTAISTASDVYALGVLAYELLCGQPPLALAGLAYADARQTVLESFPPPPSQRVGEPAPDGTSAATWRRALRGDLDNIVLHALKKEPHERYATVDAFMADLRRWLEQEPISLRSGHRRYRLQKFVQRNTAAVVAGSLAVLAVVAGAAAFAWQAQQARSRATELEQVVKFQSSMLEQIDPATAGHALGDDIRMRLARSLEEDSVPGGERDRRLSEFGREWQGLNATDIARDFIDRVVLQPAAGAIEKQFPQQPLVQATLDQALSERYEQIGLYDAAIGLNKRALNLRRKQLGESHPDTLYSTVKMGELYAKKTDDKRAEVYFQRALSSAAKEAPAALAALNGIGLVTMHQKRLVESEGYFKQVLETREKNLGPHDVNTLVSMNNLASLMQEMGRMDRAETLFKDVLSRRTEMLGEFDPATISALNNLAVLKYRQSKFADAEVLSREVVSKRRVKLGDHHPNTLKSIVTLAEALRQQGKLEEAEAYLREVIAHGPGAVGKDHTTTMTAVGMIGLLLRAQGKLAEAEPYLREIAARRLRVFGKTNPETLEALGNLGILLQMQGSYEESESVLQTVLEQRVLLFGDHHPLVFRSKNHMAVTYVGLNRHADAIALLDSIEPFARDRLEQKDPEHLCRLLTISGGAHAGLGRFPESEEILLEGQDVCLGSTLTTVKEKRESLLAIIALYAKWQKTDPQRSPSATVWTEKLQGLDLL